MQEIFNILPQEADAFLLGTEDEFLSEYSHPNLQRLKFLTGFSGSYGFAILGRNEGWLFVDGRYTIQAEKEKKQGFTVLPIHDLFAFLESFKGTIAACAKVHSIKFIKRLAKKGVKLLALEENPVDKIWKREISVSRETFNFDLAGESSAVKLTKVRDFIKSNNMDAMFVFDLHEVCWLFNIRGDFLENTPVAPFFAIIFQNEHKLIQYEDIDKIQGMNILLSDEASQSILNLLSLNNNVKVVEDNFIENLKSIKTQEEIDAIKKAHTEDGKAVMEFRAWVKKADLSKETEFTIGKKLLEFRKKQKGFLAESFPAIVGFKENGAIVHYHASEETAKKIEGSGLLLIDSGGQYYLPSEKIAGTTDITRVFAVGKPTEEEKRVYTLVLKGHIALASAVFPFGTTGAMLDVLARQFLWLSGLDYAHGTGHGVGYFLSVHEGPCGISKNSNSALKAGMILSNEPGCYLEGKFGVRFESLMLVKNHPNEGFLSFEVITKVAVEMELLDYTLLTDLEVQWLEDYHKF